MVANTSFNASLENNLKAKHYGAITKAKTVDLPLNELAEEKSESQLLYSLEEVPPWYLSLSLGLQHFLTVLGSTVTFPFILGPLLCIDEDDPARSYLLSSLIFGTGVITFVQATFGVRLPIIQGGTFCLLIPTFAILNLPEWKCPVPDTQDPNTHQVNFSNSSHDSITWQKRICEVQGVVLVASLFEIMMGLTGMVGVFLRFVSPLTTTCVISLIGLSLFDVAAEFASGNWVISMLTVCLLLLFSLYLRDVNVPCCSYRRENGCNLVGAPIFKLFPVLIGLVLVWGLCFVMTETNAFPPKNAARTDKQEILMENTHWFWIPYPGQWGAPTVSVAGVFGMMAGMVASILQSVGTYTAVASVSGAPPPPMHATNRGIFVEGLGNAFAALLGTGNGTTAYAASIGVTSVTKIGSRRVVQAAGLIMIAFGTISKLAALFVAIPTPVIGGIFFVVSSMIASVGLANIQFVNTNSARNILVLGIPLFFGLAIPKWLAAHRGVIQTGNRELDNVIEVMMNTSMFVGGLLSLILDNTVPATEDDRKVPVSSELCDCNIVSDENPPTCYDLPFGMSCLRNWSIAKYIPISPTYKQSNCTCRNNLANS